MPTPKLSPAEKLADEFSYLLVNSMEDQYLVDHHLVEFADENEFKISDIDKETFIEAVILKIRESADSWFESSKSDEAELFSE